MIGKFDIPENLMDYDLTKEFLAKLISLKYRNVKTSGENKEDNIEGDESKNYDDLPF